MTYAPIARALSEPIALPELSVRHRYAAQRVAEALLDFSGVDVELCPWRSLTPGQVRQLCERIAQRHPASARVLLTVLRKLLADPTLARLPRNFRRPARTWPQESAE